MYWPTSVGWGVAASLYCIMFKTYLFRFKHREAKPLLFIFWTIEQFTITQKKAIWPLFYCFSRFRHCQQSTWRCGHIRIFMNTICIIFGIKKSEITNQTKRGYWSGCVGRAVRNKDNKEMIWGKRTCILNWQQLKNYVLRKCYLTFFINI